LADVWGLLTRGLTAFLDYVESLTGSYGIAIIVFTIAVKMALYPLTLKQQKALLEQKKYAPELAKIQEKYKKKPEELQKKLMEFYRQHNYNPFGACLPLLLQIPILYLLFGVIRNHDFEGQGFLWVPLLTERDPYYIWPLLSIGLTILLQKLQEKVNPPTGADTNMSSTNMIMTLVIGFLTLTLPAGLVMYWTLSNAVTVVQYYYIYRRLEASTGEVQKT